MKTDDRTPIEVRGETLAKFKRQDRGKPERVLRVSWEEFEGHPFVRLAVWAEAKAGGYVPLKGGVSVRLSELAGVAGALQEALSRARAARQSSRPPARPSPLRTAPSRRDGAPRLPLPPGGDPRRPWADDLPPATAGGDQEFDEFDSGDPS